jgi:AcrR family transcriptional regulator
MASSRVLTGTRPGYQWAIGKTISYRVTYAGFMSSAQDTSAMATPRERRRLQTREEILDAALAVMTEQGVAALNLTEVARRVGLRQPSLYQYFSSRTEVYDGLFERGMNAHRNVVADTIAAAGPGWASVRAAMTATLRFAAEQPVLTQLLFTRPVPGFTPSERAYAPSLAVQELVSGAVATAAERGEVHPAAASPSGVTLLVALTAGVAIQQAANEPAAPADAFTPLLTAALDMYASYFDPGRPATWTPWPR